jgi:hypothetical protein
VHKNPIEDLGLVGLQDRCSPAPTLLKEHVSSHGESRGYGITVVSDAEALITCPISSIEKLRGHELGHDS